MNDNTEEIAREGEYRVTITPDTYAEPPDWDGQGTVVQLDYSPRRAYVQHPKDGDDHGLAYAWQHFHGDMGLVERYLRIFHGAVGFDYFDTRDSWYVVIVTDKDLTEWGFADLADYRAHNPKPEHANPASQVMVAWQAWAEGEVYGYTIERETHWAQVNSRYEVVPETEMTTRETVESMWGYYGREDAESEAKAALARFVNPGDTDPHAKAS